ncbi:Trigger factor [Candidatus Saccharibacteria bacterium RAAC3_TM7_1]|nr:Trigger factor [Candidatus Saccharibacteria bacterium RAAC3_TM7_1]HCZ28481.1 trigger factor [Candidatus Saccharibacteria bacterium]
MKTTVKHLSPTKVLLTITLGKSELDAAEQVALTKLAREMKVAGFRKGKVPVNVAVKHVDPNVLAQQTADDALSKAVAEAFLAEDIQALERPQVELKKFVTGQEMEFTAEAEVLPEIKLGNYKKLGVKQQPITVTADEVNDILTRMQEGMSEKKEVERAAKDGDEVILDFIGKKDDVAFDGGGANDYALKLGSNSFIPGFEEGIIGKKPGETFDLKLKFPENYHVADLADADVVFTTTLKKVQELALPTLDDEFAKNADKRFSSLKDLKADIKSELTAQKERETAEKLKDELVAKLIDVSDVPVPQVLIDDQMQSIEQDMTQNLMYQGLTLDQYLRTQKFKDKDEWVKKEVVPAAEKRVKAGLVLAELSKVEKVEATSQELADHITRYKQQYANNPEMSKRFDEPEIQRDVANRLLTEKTVDLLVELNKK